MEGSVEQYTSVNTLSINTDGNEEYAVQGFYKEVFLSLLDSKTVNVNRLSGKVKAYREMINKYKASYYRDSSFTPIKLPFAQQIASYEATKIQTACTNAIIKDFGNKLRMVVNKLIGLKQRISQLTSDLKKQGYSKEETKAKIKSNIQEPATQLKLAISLRDIRRIPKKFQDQKVIINYIKNIFSAYPETYNFKKDSIYYDAVENPGKHLLILN
ncbi:hypothetical protein BD770DRAFT_446807 [Pilaira anomala]|nr:hypothetical protein BD770DRAFT_446807 [Pilaira anomala]